MYGGRVIDDFDRRIVRVYMDEYMGDFLFDTFQPFHFYSDANVDYKIPIVAQQRHEFIGECFYLKSSRLVFLSSTQTPRLHMRKKNRILIDIHPQFSSITESIDSLPLANTPEIFGLHPNAEINYYNQATREIWNHLIELQPQTGEFFSTSSLHLSLPLFF